MMNLAEYRRRAQSLADFLPWAALVREGVVLNKDGSFQRTAKFRGPDLDSSTPAELVAITSRLNNALRRLGSGWAIFIEAQRSPANSYPLSQFPDPASELVDAERRAQFEEEGAHFESRYFLTLLWLPPADNSARAEAWLYENRAHDGADWRDRPRGFCRSHRPCARARRRVHARGGMARRRRDPDLPAFLRLDAAPARARAGNADVSRRDPRRRGPDRRPRAAPRRRAPPHAHHHGVPVPDLAGPARRPQPARLPLSLGDPRHLPRQDRRDEARRKDPPAMVRQAQVDHGDPQGGHDQRSVGPDGQRRRQQGDRRRRRPAGAGLRSRRRGLRHRDDHGLGRGRADRRRAASAGREDDPGPRLHLHARDGQRHRGVARVVAGPRLRQRPPAADLDAEPRPHDAVLGGLGRAGTGRAFQGAAALLRPHRRLDAVPLLAPCRRRRPHPDRRSDGRGQVRASGADGAPVPPLRGGPGLRLRFRRIDPGGRARDGRRLARPRRVARRRGDRARGAAAARRASTTPASARGRRNGSRRCSAASP